jgi:hypothetical protein
VIRAGLTVDLVRDPDDPRYWLVLWHGRPVAGRYWRREAMARAAFLDRAPDWAHRAWLERLCEEPESAAHPAAARGPETC